MTELLAVLLGFSPIGGFALGLGVFTAPDILIGLVVGYSLKNVRLSLNSWYAPGFFCFFIPLVFTRLSPPYIMIDKTFVFSFCSLVLLAGNLKTQFFKGLFLGVIIHLILLLTSLLGYPLVSEESFWAGQRRFGGLFTDPNAAGLVFFLLLGIRELRYFSCLGLFTGSRSYLLGLLFSLRLKAALAIILFLILIILAVPSEFIPSSLTRVISGGLSDRLIFWKAAFIDFISSPLVGIGPDMFRQSIRLNNTFGNWIDNPNNYYLLILSEWGIVGLFVVALSAFRFYRTGVEIPRVVFVFLGLLVLGSHLLSLEVALVLASLLRPGSKELDRDYFGVSFGLLFSILLMFSDRGLYPWEKDSEGYFRWTKERATFMVSCKDDLAVLKVEREAKIISRNQVFKGENIIIPCGSRSKVRVTLTALEPFIPINDPRVLGSKIRYESP